MTEDANTFGEWNKWDEVRKKMADSSEELSGSGNCHAKPVDFRVDRGVIGLKSRVVSWNECVLPSWWCVL